MTINQAIAAALAEPIEGNEVAAICRKQDPGLGYVVRYGESILVRSMAVRARGASKCDRIGLDLGLEDMYALDWLAVRVDCTVTSVGMTNKINLLPMKGGPVVAIRQAALG